MEISIYYDNAVYVCLYITTCHHLKKRFFSVTKIDRFSLYHQDEAWDVFRDL